ncbi:MAG: polyhydroxyalkanoate synthesis repressor PhaR [Alphaproteobacteria bacterium]|nr:polyhydroxyalkanoate synthesis repressor PhaR [Rhodospirillales bacterium]MCW9045525.1 polyhydroxyalkanoate synthesis repressor PhaR [Alphaproteobacteria bacterium]
MAEESISTKEPITIKKYANRRLYNKATSTYVTLDHLSQMVKDDVDFVVYDAKSGENITRSVLTQIIVEEESKGQHLLPTSFLRHLISFYGDSLQGMVPKYLEHTMHSFASNQGKMRKQMQDALDGIFPFTQFEEMGKQNMAFFENAMKMMTPFQTGLSESTKQNDSSENKSEEPTKETDGNVSEAEQERRLNELKTKLADMQKQLESLTNTGKNS